jgi:hypothetical protein
MTSPWRRRLEDFGKLIQVADEAYFEPEDFRRAFNAALQTARTVTFLLQKNKATIPGFDDLHKRLIKDGLGSDPVMKWMIEARNTVEKEGDLATYSAMRARVIASHTDDTPWMDAESEEVLFAGTLALQRMWSKRTPDWYAESSVLVIERRWVANTLPEHELLDALIHGHRRLGTVVDAMDQAAGFQPAKMVDMTGAGSAMRKVFIKLSDGRTYAAHQAEIPLTPARAEQARARYGGLNTRFLDPALSVSEHVEAWADLACTLFNKDGYHNAMYMLFGREGKPLKFGHVAPADRAEKYLFWRLMGDLALANPDFHALFYIDEVWVREVGSAAWDGNVESAPITGEQLVVWGEAEDGERHELRFPIRRDGEAATVDRTITAPQLEGATMNMLDALRHAWAVRTHSG